MIVVLSKLVSAFLIPPGVVVLAFLGIAWIAWSRARGKALSFFSLSSALILYLLSTEPVADLLLRSLEDRYAPLTLPGAVIEKTGGGPNSGPGNALSSRPILLGLEGIDGVVVLGGGVVSRSPDVGLDDLRPDPLKRLLHGLRLARELQRVEKSTVPLIFSGGRVFDVGQDSEAEVMKRYALEWGPPGFPLLVEGDSRTTWQNAQNVVKRFRVRKVVLVTSAYHMPRAVWCFQRQGVEVLAAPTDYKVNRGLPYDMESYLPTLNGFQNSRRALHEYLGMFLYSLTYRIDRNF